MPHFEMRRLLREALTEGGVNSGLSVTGAALIKGWHLFETRRFLEKIRYYVTKKIREFNNLAQNICMILLF